MPTLTEVKELVDNCTFTGGSYNGVRGYYVTGPNGNSIFLPFHGYLWVGGLRYDGSRCYFWSGTYYDGSGDDDYNDYDYNDYDIGFGAYRLYCDKDGGYWNYNHRSLGQSVRPVKDK